MHEIQTKSFEIYSITDNPLYKELFNNVPDITQVISLNTVDAEVSCKAIFIDGVLIPATDLKDIRGLFPNIPIFYRITNIQNNYLQKNIITTCAAYEVTPLDETLTPKQVVDEISSSLFHKEFNSKRRIVSFFGTHSGAGVSTTLLNVADLLAKRIEGRVLVLSLNPWDPSDYFMNYNGRFLNDLKIDLKTENLSDDKFLNSLHQYSDNFYHLAGNRDIKLQRFFKIEEIEYLLERARNLFDVVLVDGGPHFDNACYAQAYRGSDLRFLITTQEPKGYQGYWPHIFSQLLEPLSASTHDFLLVLNRFAPLNVLATEKDISEQLNMTLITSISEEGSLGSSAITQKKLLHLNGASKEYTESLMVIVRAIISEYKLKEKEGIPTISSKSLFGRLFNKKNKDVV